jgi:hypothetical protein
MVTLPAVGALTVSHHGGGQSGDAAGMLHGDVPTMLTDGKATFVAEAPFPLQVELRLRSKGRAPQAVAVAPATIDPAQLREGQTVELRCDAAAVQAVLQRLAGR